MCICGKVLDYTIRPIAVTSIVCTIPARGAGMDKYDIAQHQACREAQEWYNGQPTTDAAWEACHRGDWMLWIARKLEVAQRLRLLAAARCADTVRHLMVDERSRVAVRVALAYGQGRASRKQLRAAYADAGASTIIQSGLACNMAAVAAMAAANDIPSHIAAAAAADAMWYADTEDARRHNRQATAEICRDVLTDAVMAAVKASEHRGTHA